jgi:hypothetical protein
MVRLRTGCVEISNSKKAFYFEIIENKVKQRKIYIQYIQNDWTDGLYLNSQTCIQRTVTTVVMCLLFNDLHIEGCFKNKKMVKNMKKKNEN